MDRCAGGFYICKKKKLVEKRKSSNITIRLEFYMECLVVAPLNKVAGIESECLDSEI